MSVGATGSVFFNCVLVEHKTRLLYMPAVAVGEATRKLISSIPLPCEDVDVKDIPHQTDGGNLLMIGKRTNKVSRSSSKERQKEELGELFGYLEPVGRFPVGYVRLTWWVGCKSVCGHDEFMLWTEVLSPPVKVWADRIEARRGVLAKAFHEMGFADAVVWCEVK